MLIDLKYLVSYNLTWLALKYPFDWRILVSTLGFKSENVELQPVFYFMIGSIKTKKISFWSEIISEENPDQIIGIDSNPPPKRVSFQYEEIVNETFPISDI